jgi:ABC-2 type transport system permease protein
VAVPDQAHDATTVVSSRPRVSGVLGEVWRYRELLGGLIRKELKVKYKDSALGFVWSMLNPAMYLVVFYIVFEKLLGSGIPHFEIFLLTGLLVWNLFSAGVVDATGSVVANSSLVNKVYFPRAILPLASVGAAIVNFFIQAVVLIIALALFRYDVAWAYMPLLIPALLALILLTASMALLLSAVNVYARDTQHLVELGLLGWLTPIVYPFRSVADKLSGDGLPSGLLLLNPVTSIVLTFQRALYAQVGGDVTGSIGRAIGGQEQPPGTPAILPVDATQWWYLRNIGIVAAASLVILFIALTVFRRLEGNFAEEL